MIKRTSVQFFSMQLLHQIVHPLIMIQKTSGIKLPLPVLFFLTFGLRYFLLKEGCYWNISDGSSQTTWLPHLIHPYSSPTTLCACLSGVHHGLRLSFFKKKSSTLSLNFLTFLKFLHENNSLLAHD